MNKIIFPFIVLILAAMVLAAPVISDSGKKPIQWRTNLATDANILHKDVFPGIDLIYSGNQQRIEATLIVNPGADPDDISLDFTGITNLEMNEQNHGFIQTSEGTIDLFPPNFSQEYNGKLYKVEGSYWNDAGNKLGVKVSTYNQNYPLKIRIVVYFTDGSDSENIIATPNIIATKRDSLLFDNDIGGDADPGDSLRYTIIIQNIGNMNADTTKYDDTVDVNTTLNPGSIRTTPIARNDSYDCIGNVGIAVPLASGVLANDNDPDGGAVTVTSSDAVSTNGGTVAVAADGSFTYDPAPGYEGPDSFTYTILDTDGNTDPATVFITVSDMIWFIDKSVASNGDGRRNTPYKTIGDYNTAAADDPGDNIFLAEDPTYDNGITLKDNQKLIGDGSSSDLATVLSISVPSFSTSLPSFSGTDPVISGIFTTNGINLAQGNTVRGLTVGNCPTGISISGTTVGTFTILETSVIGSGGALSISTSGTVGTAQFDQLGTTGPPAATDVINLTNVIGTISIASGTIVTVASGTGVLIGGAACAVTMTYPGSITKNSTGKIIHIQNNFGNLNFNGAVNQNFATGEGIHIIGSSSGSVTFNAGVNLGTGTPLINDAVTLSSFGSTTVNFLGGLNIGTTSTGDGLVATGGGTVNVTGATNTINTTTGTGINITSTNIGGSGVTFQSINTTTASASPGIVLNTTGTSGGLTVTGTGTAGTGGTISNKTGHGISLTSTIDVSLAFMHINNNGPNGINGINVTGPNNSISNCVVDGSTTRNVHIENNTGTANVTVTNSTFNNAGSETGLDFLGLGSANITFSVTGSSFYRNNSVQLKALADGSSTIDATITSNTFEGNPAVSGNSGIDLDAIGGGTLTFDVIGTVANPQTFQPFRSHPINVFASGGGTAEGFVTRNTILGSAFGSGIRVVSQVTDFNGFNPSITIDIDNNSVSLTGGGLAGIHIEARDGTSGLTGTATIEATVSNNSVFVDGLDAAIQVYLSDLNGTVNRVCLNGFLNSTQALNGTFGDTDFFFGNDAISGSNSGLARMEGFATSVSNTWFTVNGNTSTTTSPFALGLGPISGATCVTPTP